MVVQARPGSDAMCKALPSLVAGETMVNRTGPQRGLSSIIEPLLIILLGGVVIFIALAALLPYFSLINAIQG